MSVRPQGLGFLRRPGGGSREEPSLVIGEASRKGTGRRCPATCGAGLPVGALRDARRPTRGGQGGAQHARTTAPPSRHRPPSLRSALRPSGSGTRPEAPFPETWGPTHSHAERPRRSLYRVQAPGGRGGGRGRGGAASSGFSPAAPRRPPPCRPEGVWPLDGQGQCIGAPRGLVTGGGAGRVGGDPTGMTKGPVTPSPVPPSLGL